MRITFAPPTALLPLLALALLGGCGGAAGPQTATIAGTVLYLDNSAVIDAKVSTRDATTRSSTTGAYALNDVREGTVEITAEVSKGGVLYRGRNTTLTFENEVSNSVNIVVGPVRELGAIRGVVTDRAGNRLANASVFMYSGAGSSQRVFTGEDGWYQLSDVIPNLDYRVRAAGVGFRGDEASPVSIRPRQTIRLDFVLGDPGLPGLSAPTGLGVTTWVSPRDAVRSTGADPSDAVKRAFDPDYDPTRRRPLVRSIVGTSLVEANLEWDERGGPDFQGWGVYRAEGGASLRGIDFYFEPLAAYYVDVGLRTGRDYRYAVSAISALYPEFPDRTEGPLSAEVAARTLSPLTARGISGTPLTARWLGGSRAERFVVYIWEEFPSVDEPPVWSNESAPTPDLSLVIPASAGLVPGRTYYFAVLGIADGVASRTISQIAPFRP